MTKVQSSLARFAKSSWLSVLIFLAALLYFIYCGVFLYPQESNFAKQIITAHTTDHKPLPINNITNFDWDKVCLILPYEDIITEGHEEYLLFDGKINQVFTKTELQEIKEKLGHRFWVGNEGTWWLLFFKENILIQPIRFSFTDLIAGHRHSYLGMRLKRCNGQSATIYFISKTELFIGEK